MMSSTWDIFTSMQTAQDHNSGIYIYHVFCMKTVQSGKAIGVDPGKTFGSWSGSTLLVCLFSLLSSLICFVWKAWQINQCRLK